MQRWSQSQGLIPVIQGAKGITQCYNWQFLFILFHDTQWWVSQEKKQSRACKIWQIFFRFFSWYPLGTRGKMQCRAFWKTEISVVGEFKVGSSRGMWVLDQRAMPSQWLTLWQWCSNWIKMVVDSQALLFHWLWCMEKPKLSIWTKYSNLLWPLFKETTDSAVGCFDFECTKFCFLSNWNLKDFVSSVFFSGEFFAILRQRNWKESTWLSCVQVTCHILLKNSWRKIWNFFLSCWNLTSFRQNFTMKKKKKKLCL